jgi:hypothetical protein
MVDRSSVAFSDRLFGSRRVYGASRRLTFLNRRPIVSGVLYGIAVYIFMYWGRFGNWNR